MKRPTSAAWCLMALTLSGTETLADSTLYATNATLQRNELYILSRDDASATLVGSFGVAGYMAGLAYDASDGILLGAPPARTTFTISTPRPLPLA